jgi:hypothetical protein
MDFCLHSKETIYLGDMNEEEKNEYTVKNTIQYSKEQQLILDNDRNILEKSIKTTLGSKVYMDNIKKNLYNVLGDFTIGINDIPFIINIILDSISLLKNIVKINLSKNFTKYIIFAIIFRFVINDGKITNFEKSVLKTYESIWKILTFSPNMIFGDNFNCDCDCNKECICWFF